MIYEIKNDASLSELQTAFNAAFPYLKLAFFDKAHDHHRGTPIKNLISDPLKTFAQIRPEGRRNEGRLFVEADMAVWQLERLLEQDFGLHAHVFRKSGSAWLETSVTDDLSLREQNDRGRAYENPLEPIEDLIDYREPE